MAALIAKCGMENIAGLYNIQTTGDQAWSAMGQTFIGNGKKIGSCMWYISKEGTGSGNLYAKIYGISGDTPNGAALATSDLVTSTNVGAETLLYTFTFSGANQITLTDGTTYGATIECDAGDRTTNMIDIAIAGSVVAGNGFVFRVPESSWFTLAPDDLVFYIYDNQFSPLMNYHQM